MLLLRSRASGLSRRSGTLFSTHVRGLRQGYDTKSASGTLFPSPRKSTGEQVTSFCLAKGYGHSVNDLNPGSGFPVGHLHNIEIDPNRSGGVLLYLHGGGFTFPAGLGHLRLAARLTESLKCRKLSILEYTLLPAGVYPTQLAQAAAAIRLLCEHNESSEIAIAGDSAGGNLVLGLLAHVHEPHPRIEPVNLPAPLASAICISPRCSNSTASASFTTNASKDIINASMTQRLFGQWCPIAGHVWAAADNGDQAFWSNAKVSVLRKIFLMAGANECYLDDIRSFAQTLGVSPSATTDTSSACELAIIEDAVHAQVFIDFAKGCEQGRIGQILFKWPSENPIG